jgi:LuxR family maltose regulon positive regulatory protein
MEALCRYKLGNNEESFRALEEAWALAQPNDFIAPFADAGKDMRALTNAALEAGTLSIERETLERMRLAASAYAKHLALVQKEFQNEETKKPVLSEELSSRELQVLTGFFHGLTGEEIALEMDISINTVKGTIKRIYNKLGALNKVDAIRIAIRHGILKNEDI